MSKKRKSPSYNLKKQRFLKILLPSSSTHAHVDKNICDQFVVKSDIIIPHIRKNIYNSFKNIIPNISHTRRENTNVNDSESTHVNVSVNASVNVSENVSANNNINSNDNDPCVCGLCGKDHAIFPSNSKDNINAKDNIIEQQLLPPIEDDVKILNWNWGEGMFIIN